MPYHQIVGIANFLNEMTIFYVPTVGINHILQFIIRLIKNTCQNRVKYKLDAKIENKRKILVTLDRQNQINDIF